MPIDFGGHFIVAKTEVTTWHLFPIIIMFGVIVNGRGRASKLHLGGHLQGCLVHPLLDEVAVVVGVHVTQCAMMPLAIGSIIHIVAKCKVAKHCLTGMAVAVPSLGTLESTIEDRFGLVREIRLKLHQATFHIGQPLDELIHVIALGPCSQFQCIHSIDRAMRTDIKEGAIALLRWPQLANQGSDVVEIVIVIATQLGPAVDPFVEIIKKENTANRIEFTQSRSAADKGGLQFTDTRHSLLQLDIDLVF